MMDPANRTVPQPLIDALKSSTRDIATGAVSDAGDVQAEVRRMLAEFERASWPSVQASGATKRTGTA